MMEKQTPARWTTPTQEGNGVEYAGVRPASHHSLLAMDDIVVNHQMRPLIDASDLGDQPGTD
jgi:hypothetical protein